MSRGTRRKDFQKSENFRKGIGKVQVIHIAPGKPADLSVGFMNVSNCILTDRLILRTFVKGDEEDLLALMSDEDAAQFMRGWRKERFTITIDDFEGEQSGMSVFSTAARNFCNKAYV